MTAAQSREIDTTLAETYTLPDGAVIRRDTGAWLDRRTGNSLWIGSNPSSVSGWYLYDEASKTLTSLGPSFANRVEASAHLVHHVEQAGMLKGMKAPLYHRDCLKYRGRCESYDVEDDVTKAVFAPGHWWAWISIPVSLPAALAADVVWDGLKDVWLSVDTLAQTDSRFGRYRVIWRSGRWMNRLLYRPNRGREIAHRHFGFLVNTLKKASEAKTEHGSQGGVP